MFNFIDNGANDRIYLYLFITNTCEIVEGLTPAHIITICQLYRQMSDEQLKAYS